MKLEKPSQRRKQKHRTIDFFRSMFYFKKSVLFQRKGKGQKVTLNCFSCDKIDQLPERRSKFFWDPLGKGAKLWCIHSYPGRHRGRGSVEQSIWNIVGCCRLWASLWSGSLWPYSYFASPTQAKDTPPSRITLFSESLRKTKTLYHSRGSQWNSLH